MKKMVLFGGCFFASVLMILLSVPGSSSAQSVGWIQTDWSGGAGQALWSDVTSYESGSGIDDSFAGQVSLASTKTILVSDDFTRDPIPPDPLSPWVSAMGTWSVSGGVMQGSGSLNEYSYAYLSGAWTDYMVQASIQIPAGSYGGGIGGRLDPATGAHYGAWIYPTGSAGGSNVLKLWKFVGWTDIGSGIPMDQVSLPDVGTGWHIMQMAFIGNRILVYYDGVLKIDVTDNDFGSQAAYLSGGVSADWWSASESNAIIVDNVSVTTLPVYGSSGVLTSSAFDGGEGVQWQTISWDAAAALPGVGLCVRTRTADTSDQLAGGAWSGCYSGSGAKLTSGNGRWIQYQLELASSDSSISPFVYEVGIFAIGGELSAVHHIVISPSSSSIMAGGRQAYTAEAFDQNNNSLGDVTASTTFTIGPDGSCTGASCTAAVAGTHTVTGTYGGKTSPAATLNVTKANQTITFGPLADRNILDSPFTIGATASSGLPVSFSSQTASVCTVSGNTVTLKHTGNCAIQATQGGDTNYNAATPVVQSFNVSSALSVKKIDGVTTTYYATVQAAFAAAAGGDTIQAQEFTSAEDLDFNPTSEISINLEGGYDSDFTSQVGYTTMNSMIITNGRVTVDRLIIQ